MKGKTFFSFQKTVRDFYISHKRSLPWRDNISPYGVVISEIMLQQTQVARVLQKYPTFMSRFPTFKDLARAQTKDVLQEWQGMGYNRRGLYLKQIAEQITHTHNGQLPKDPALLDAMPGIGPATACAIVTYRYNVPTVFIETNIRRVFLHHFFPDSEQVSDKEILPLVEKTLDTQNPRQWYYALMDYGTFLGKTQANANVRSKHYAKQSQFEGSDRQLRSKIVKLLLEKERLEKETLFRKLDIDHDRFERIMDKLVQDKLIFIKERTIHITH